MAEKWKYRGREIDPDTLPTKDQLIAQIQAKGGDHIDFATLYAWPYEGYGEYLVAHHLIHPGSGCFIMPVREGLLGVPYGNRITDRDHALHVSEAELLTEEDCWDMYEDNVSWWLHTKDDWKEAIEICKNLGLHDQD